MYSKTVPARNPHLLAMARGRECLMRVDWHHRAGTETTVAAHSNEMAHGKAKGRKADDFYSVWACHGCHSWYDQGKADKAVKRRAFAAAYMAQLHEWNRIASDPMEKPKDRDAAQWALDRLDEARELKREAANV